jgi:hypothetical protein
MLSALERQAKAIKRIYSPSAGLTNVNASQRRRATAIVIAVGLILVFYLPTQSRSAVSGNLISLDSSISSGCNGCTSQSIGLQVTQGDLVVVQVALSPESVLSRGGGYAVLTSLESAWPGMPFQQRYVYITNPGSGDGSMVWEEYAVAPVTGTVTITGTTNSSEAAWDMIGYSVKGANTTAPFDTNPGIPNHEFSDCNPVDGCSLTFSTTSAETFVIVGIGSESCTSASAPSNFTLIQSTCNSAWVTDAVAYHVFSAPQRNANTGSWVLSPGESALWFVDAIEACVGTCPTGPSTAAVVQPVSLAMTNSAPSADVTVNGCSSSPSTFPSDGKSYPIVMLPSCAFTLSFSNSGDVRNGFSDSGSFTAISSSQSSCSTGTCSGIQLTAYQQLLNSYDAKPVNPAAWDANLTIPVTGTQLGTAGQTGCSISTAKLGGVASCTAWFDYRSQVTVASPDAVSGTEQWTPREGGSFSQATAGNQDTVLFIDQFQISFIVSPAGVGSTNPSGSSVWESYGSLPITATPNGGYLFNTWSSDSGGITFASAGKANTTATILGAGSITAKFSPPATLPITLALVEQQGTPANFTLSGCSVSPVSLPGDGKSHSFTALPSCQLTIMVSSGSPNVRYGFDSEDSVSSTTSLMTCSEQTCQEFSTAYYEQVSQQFAYAVFGGAAPYVKAPVLGYTSLGTPTTYTVTGNPTNQWLDFGTPWSFTNPLTGSIGSERWFASTGVSGTATAGQTQITTYQHQYSILIAASPADCGSTTPSSAIWEDSGDNFQVSGSPVLGCTFSGWDVAGLIAVAQPGQLSTTVFADSNGTLTALFTRNVVPTFSASTLILITGGGVMVATAAAIGILFMRSRRLRSRAPHE